MRRAFFRELAKLGDARMEELGSCLLAEGGKGENDGGSAQGCAEGGRKLTIGQQRNESCWQMLAKLKKVQYGNWHFFAIAFLP